MSEQYGGRVLRAELGEVQLDTARINEPVAGASKMRQVSDKRGSHSRRIPA